MGVWVATVRWLFDKLLRIQQEDKKSARDVRDRVAKYLKAVSEALKEMVKQFNAGEIPSETGHQFEVLASSFRSVLLQTYNPENADDVKIVTEMDERVKELRQRARSLDSFLRSGQKPTDRELEWILDMSRMIGELDGVADLLRAANI